jgi:hypothetical protein
MNSANQVIFRSFTSRNLYVVPAHYSTLIIRELAVLHSSAFLQIEGDEKGFVQWLIRSIIKK